MSHTSKLHRNIPPVALLFTGLSSIIGSGWLFGAYNAAKLSGPAAILAWLIGLVIMMVITITYIELGTMFPESGAMGRYTQYSHGPFAGLIASWANWLSMVGIPAIEAVASVQYMATWSFGWTQSLVIGGHLTSVGLALASVLLVAYCLLNYWTVGLFAKSNSAITLFKLIVPLLTGIMLLVKGFHPQNFQAMLPSGAGGFAPYGWAAIFTSVATSGIVFSFNGFQAPINLAGEATNPRRSVPTAVIGSLLLSGAIYVLLQTAFISAVDPATLTQQGWKGLVFKSPFAELATTLGMGWLALTLYADAVISPSGTGITYVATSSRALQALSRSGYLPSFLENVHPVFGVPRAAIITNLVVSLAALYFFPNWEGLAAVISLTCVIGFLTGPISAATLRRVAPQVARPLRVSGMNIIAPIAFILGSLLVYWSTWPLNGQIMLVILLAAPLYLYAQARRGWQDTAQQLRSGIWLLAYLLCMTALSYLGGKPFGGLGLIPYGWDMVAVAVLALAFYFWALNSGHASYLPSEEELKQAAEEVAH